MSAQFPPESGQGGGIGTTFRVIAEGLIKSGHAVHVISKAPGSSAERTYNDASMIIRRIQPVGHALKGFWRLEQLLSHWLPLYQWRYALRVAQALRELTSTVKVDLIVSPEWNAETLLFARRADRLPIVIVLSGGTYLLREHNGWRAPSTWLLNRLEAALVRRAQGLTAMSQPMAQVSAQRYGVPVERITAIPNGVDLERFHSNGAVARAEEPIVLFVGRLERLKGVEVLARAIPLVLQRCPKARFQFIGKDLPWPGSGQMASAYLTEVMGEAACAHVEFHPPLSHEQLVNRYQHSTVCVFPSYFESFGNVVAEAMACGKPVITTDRAGIASLIEHGRDSWIVPSGDVHRLAEAIVTLLEDAALREQISSAARVTIEAQCSPSKFLVQYQRLFGKVISMVERHK